MQSWQLPEHIADILPSTARQLESAKERLLALFRVHGYELVQPPMMEYSNSLLTHIDAGLALKTIRVVDQLSGRQLGIRADITPQVARIDAHLLSANNGINRLCYAGSVLHARPDGFLNTREPLQVGAELYGLAGVEADIELIDLMLKSLKIGEVGELLLSLGHIGVFRALAAAAELDDQQSAQLLALMQDKDAAAVYAQVAAWQLDGMWAKAFALLPTLYGGREVLEEARGGRYDGLGGYFGRARPATGFSFDLRTFTGRLPKIRRLPAIAVAQQDVAQAAEIIAQLRAEGQCVVIDYGIESNASRDVTSRLVAQDGKWVIVEQA